MKLQYQKTSRVKIESYGKLASFVILLMFLINPAMGSLVAFIYLLFTPRNFIPLHFLSVIFSLYLGIINNLKQRDIGDTVSILADFKRASNMSYWEFFFDMFEEPFYASLIWMSNRIFFEHFGLFCLLSSVLFYHILGLSVIKIGKVQNFTFNNYKLAFVILFFFPFIFTWSFHTTRQVLGFAFFMWFLSDFLLYSRYNFKLLILSFFTHTSIILYSPFMLYYLLIRKYSNKTSIIISSVFFGLIFVGYSTFVNYLTYTSKINSRFQESGFDDGLSINPTVYLLLVLIILVTIIYWFRTKENKSVLNLFIFTAIVSILTSENFPLISYRFTINFYILIPFASFYFIKDSIINKIIVFILSILIFSWFNYYLFNGPWYYGSEETIYLNNYFNNFYGLFN